MKTAANLGLSSVSDTEVEYDMFTAKETQDYDTDGNVIVIAKRPVECYAAP